MAVASIDVQVRGIQEGKKGFNELLASYEKLSKSGGGSGPFAAAEYKKSSEAVKVLNAFQKITLSDTHKFVDGLKQVNSELAKINAKYKDAKKGTEKNSFGERILELKQQRKDLTSLRNLSSGRYEASQSLSSTIQGRLDQTRGPSGPGVVEGAASGLGIGGLLSNPEFFIGALAGKMVSAAYMRTLQQMKMLTSAAGTANGNISGVLSNAVRGMGTGTQGQVLAMGFRPEDELNTISGINATGARLSRNSSESNQQMTNMLLTNLAYSRVGVSEGQSNGLRRAGVLGGAEGGLGLGAETQQRIFSAAVKSGMEGVRTGEFFDEITKIATATEQTADKVDINSIASIAFAASKSGNPSLMGERGAKNLTSMTDALTNPGGGIAGQLFMLNAAGFGKKNNYYQAMATLQMGLTPGLLQNELKMIGGKDGQSQIMQLAATNKLSFPTAAAILGRDTMTGNRIFDKTTGKYQENISDVLSKKGYSNLNTEGAKDEMRKLLKERGGDLADVSMSNSSLYEHFAALLTGGSVVVQVATAKLTNINSDLSGSDTAKKFGTEAALKQQAAQGMADSASREDLQSDLKAKGPIYQALVAALPPDQKQLYENQRKYYGTEVTGSGST